MNRAKSSPVIVRGYADEPVVLTAIGRHENAIELIGEDATQPATLGQEWVYAHSPSGLRKLRSAFQSGDQTRLIAAWQSMPLFDCSALPEMECAE